MLYPEGLMHRKVNIGLALLVIFIIAGIFAWIISARAVSFPGIALVVTSPPIKCVPDPPPDEATCLLSCQTCGILPDCSLLSEVKATYLSGSPLLMQGAGGPALCLAIPAPPLAAPNPTFTPGSFCLGNIQFNSAGHFLTNFGCSF